MILGVEVVGSRVSELPEALFPAEDTHVSQVMELADAVDILELEVTEVFAGRAAMAVIWVRGHGPYEEDVFVDSDGRRFIRIPSGRRYLVDVFLDCR